MSTRIDVYATVLSPPEPDFGHRLLLRRDPSDPSLTAHLEDLVAQLGQHAHEPQKHTLYHVTQHLRRSRRHLQLELADDAREGFADWARRANAVYLSADGTVHDPLGRVLLAPQATAIDAAASVPYPADALARKARSERQLQAMGIHAPTMLAPIPAASEILLQLASTVMRRMLALFAVAIRAETLLAGKPIPVAEIRQRLPLAWEALSPREQAFLDDPEPGEQQVIDFRWRYEAVALLQWALGLTAHLPLPQAVCEVPQAAQLALQSNHPDVIAQARLRPADEVLDAADLHHRLRGAIGQALLDGHEVPEGLQLGVLVERNRALDWLIRLEHASWDALDTTA